MTKKFLLLLIGCLLVLTARDFYAPDRAMACSCAERPSMEEQLERKTAVFAGEVQSVVKPRRVTSSADLVKAVFTVNKVWKGNVGKETVVYTALSSASCGYEGFREGQMYIVFAYGDPDKLETGLCEGTRPISPAKQELADLGTGIVPRDPAPVHANTAAAPAAKGSGWLTAGVALLAAAVIAAVIVFGRKRRS